MRFFAVPFLAPESSSLEDVLADGCASWPSPWLPASPRTCDERFFAADGTSIKKNALCIFPSFLALYQTK